MVEIAREVELQLESEYVTNMIFKSKPCGLCLVASLLSQGPLSQCNSDSLEDISSNVFEWKINILTIFSLACYQNLINYIYIFLILTIQSHYPSLQSQIGVKKHLSFSIFYGFLAGLLGQ